MRREYVIAYDLGTSGVKAVLTDLKGHFIDAATEEYSLVTPKAGWAGAGSGSLLAAGGKGNQEGAGEVGVPAGGCLRNRFRDTVERDHSGRCGWNGSASQHNLAGRQSRENRRKL